MLTKLCSEVAAEIYCDAFIKVCEYVLVSQVVAAENHDPEVWMVTRGFGMGLICSPDIVNTAFDRLVETKISKELRAATSLVRYLIYG